MIHKNAALTVADVMRTDVKTVRSTMTLPELEAELLRAHVSGCPVVDDNQLVGVVSRSDIVRQLCAEREVAEVTSDFHFDERNFYEIEMASLKDIADRVGERIESLCVKDVMVTNPFTARIDQPIADVAKRLVDHEIHRMPVTDKGILVGIITTTDLVRMIADERLVDARRHIRD
tara:strand:- start:112779 stop:113303 length:525 start_codon:yes stop_codon:yes gene_type:complete